MNSKIRKEAAAEKFPTLRNTVSNVLLHSPLLSWITMTINKGCTMALVRKSAIANATK
jgi:hypothetical protein